MNTSFPHVYMSAWYVPMSGKSSVLSSNVVILHQGRGATAVKRERRFLSQEDTENSLPCGSVGEMRKSRISLSLHLTAHLLTRKTEQRIGESSKK